MSRKVLWLSMLLACGQAPSTPFGIPTPTTYRQPTNPPRISVCEDGNRLGYWVGNCVDQFCLPGHDVKIMCADMLVQPLLAYSDASLLYGATEDPTRQCEGVAAWHVWALTPLPPTWKPLQSFVGSVRLADYADCGAVVDTTWVSVHPEVSIYYASELDLSSLN